MTVADYGRTRRRSVKVRYRTCGFISKMAQNKKELREKERKKERKKERSHTCSTKNSVGYVPKVEGGTLPGCLCWHIFSPQKKESDKRSTTSCHSNTTSRFFVGQGTFFSQGLTQQSERNTISAVSSSLPCCSYSSGCKQR